MTLPKHTPAAFSRATGQEHPLTLHIPPLKLRVRLLQIDDTPIANETVELELRDRTMVCRTTDADGILEASLTQSIGSAVLRFADQELHLDIGRSLRSTRCTGVTTVSSISGMSTHRFETTTSVARASFWSIVRHVEGFRSRAYSMRTLREHWRLLMTRSRHDPLPRARAASLPQALGCLLLVCCEPPAEPHTMAPAITLRRSELGHFTAHDGTRYRLPTGYHVAAVVSPVAYLFSNGAGMLIAEWSGRGYYAFEDHTLVHTPRQTLRLGNGRCETLAGASELPRTGHVNANDDVEGRFGTLSDERYLTEVDWRFPNDGEREVTVGGLLGDGTPWIVLHTQVRHDGKKVAASSEMHTWHDGRWHATWLPPVRPTRWPHWGRVEVCRDAPNDLLVFEDNEALLASTRSPLVVHRWRRDQPPAVASTQPGNAASSLCTSTLEPTPVSAPKEPPLERVDGRAPLEPVFVHGATSSHPWLAFDTGYEKVVLTGLPFPDPCLSPP